jgi:hypothetical protein
MERARRHQRALARLALIFLALCAELFGREPLPPPRLRPARPHASYSGAPTTTRSCSPS